MKLSLFQFYKYSIFKKTPDKDQGWIELMTLLDGLAFISQTFVDLNGKESVENRALYMQHHTSTQHFLYTNLSILSIHG